MERQERLDETGQLEVPESQDWPNASTTLGPERPRHLTWVSPHDFVPNSPRPCPATPGL